MVDIAGLIPLTLSGIVAAFVNSLLAGIIIIIADKLVAHNTEAKRALMVSGIALFITPVLGAFAAGYTALPAFLSGIVFAYLLPLIVWIVLGEALLGGDMKAKLKVMIIAFVAYTVLSFTAGPAIVGFVAGFLP